MNNLPKDDQDKENPTTSTEEIKIGSLDGKETSPSPKIDQTEESKEPKSEIEKQFEKDEKSIPKTAPPIEENQEKVEPVIVSDIKEEPIKTNVQQVAEEEQSPITPPKSKIKNISAIISLLVIIVALPTSLFLVKQRQEIRKEAETPGLSGSVSLCGITVSPVSQNFNNETYTFTYSVSGSGQKVEIHAYACACTDGNRGSCGTSSGKCNSDNQTLTAPFTRSIKAPQIGDCGTYQGDVFVLSVDGNKECYTNK